MARSSRRNFVRSAGSLSIGGALAFGTLTRPVSASVQLSGTLETHNGRRIGERIVHVVAQDESKQIRTDSQGRFTVSIDGNKDYRLGFYKAKKDDAILTAPIRNEVPHIRDLGRYSVEGNDRDLGTIRLPKAYLVNYRALDECGNPIEGASPGFGQGVYGNGCCLSTNADGWTQIDGASFTGIETRGVTRLGMTYSEGGEDTDKLETDIEGPTTIVFQRGMGGSVINQNSPTPTESPTASPTTTISKTSTQTIESSPTAKETEIRSPSPTSAPTPSTSPTVTQVRSNAQATTISQSRTTRPARGSSRNGPGSAEIEFLSDPINLTMGGFILSVGGILYHIIRGR